MGLVSSSSSRKRPRQDDDDASYLRVPVPWSTVEESKAQLSALSSVLQRSLQSTESVDGNLKRTAEALQKIEVAQQKVDALLKANQDLMVHWKAIMQCARQNRSLPAAVLVDGVEGTSDMQEGIVLPAPPPRTLCKLESIDHSQAFYLEDLCGIGVFGGCNVVMILRDRSVSKDGMEGRRAFEWLDTIQRAYKTANIAFSGFYCIDSEKPPRIRGVLIDGQSTPRDARPYVVFALSHVRRIFQSDKTLCVCMNSLSKKHDCFDAEFTDATEAKAAAASLHDQWNRRLHSVSSAWPRCMNCQTSAMDAPGSRIWIDGEGTRYCLCDGCVLQTVLERSARSDFEARLAAPVGSVVPQLALSTNKATTT